MLRAKTTADAKTAIGAEPSRATATDAELLVGAATDIRGFSAAVLKGIANRAGTTAARPTTATVGFGYFDTTLGKPIWLKTAPSTWVDATGLTV